MTIRQLLGGLPDEVSRAEQNARAAGRPNDRDDHEECADAVHEELTLELIGYYATNDAQS